MFPISSRNTQHASTHAPPASTAEIAAKADFSRIRYAQVWEDTDVLLAGLAVQPGETCLSIAAAGDNTLALLACDPARVIALDLNPAQLYCLELRVAAYRMLSHAELLRLMGSRAGADRAALYGRCRPLLETAAQNFWDSRVDAIIRHGLGGVGKFERYFRIFRRWVLPLVHNRQTVQALLTPKSLADRQRFFDERWNTRRWRLLMRTFFSQRLMGLLGRDPAFFTYVDGSFADHVAAQIRRGLCDLDPANNPYLHWILTGTHGAQLPFALRPENFARIRANLDRLEWHQLAIEEYAAHSRAAGIQIDKFNLSNIFEYMSAANYQRLLTELTGLGRLGSRLLYWNMLVPRTCPPALRDRLQPLTTLAGQLYRQDQAIFYSALQIEEVV
jgi:S-adenosylmethionine-diacylglycerol 3-amino-3-carboxypropyl transferase